MKIKIITNNPVAEYSKDHTVPKGTKADNTKNNSFITKVIKVKNEVRYLDLGCAGGGFVQQFIEQGQFAIGVDGSDYSQIHKRAEWGIIPNNLFTADITKPFYFLNEENNNNVLFNVISAFDVLEHLKEEELEGFFNNLKLNLSKDGHFICSIAEFEDAGYHHTLKPASWWIDKFKENGFIQDEFLEGGEYGRISSHNLTFKYA
jgi:cyclopropane fatty-acyl-phospholipid synthase-like methyltransferase